MTASELLLRRAVAHLGEGAPLPEVKLAAFDADDRRRWRASLPIDGVGSAHDARRDERITVYLAFSDDRDFRRCGAPILCSSSGEPCIASVPCFEPEQDDNKDAEDRFFAVPIDPENVSVGGSFREIAFTPPAELGAFERAPLIAVIVEVRFNGVGGERESVLDDVVLHTQVAFVNDELYPEYECPE